LDFSKKGVELPNLALNHLKISRNICGRKKTPAGTHRRARPDQNGISGRRDPASMSKVTVLKVDTSCAKCKRKVLQAVSGLQGTIPAASTTYAT